MSLLKKIFSIRNRRDAIGSALILMTVFGFIAFQGWAIMNILENPYNIGIQSETDIIPGTFYMGLRNTDVFSIPCDLDEDIVFIHTINAHFSNTLMEVVFEGHNCIIERVVLITGEITKRKPGVHINVAESVLLFRANETVTSITVQFTAGTISYPNFVQYVMIRVTPMSNSDIKLYKTVSLVDT